MVPLKDALLGRRFADDGDLTTPSVNMSDASAKNLHGRYSASLAQVEKACYIEGDYVERQSDLVNDEPIN
jgi:hypothetical protein